MPIDTFDKNFFGNVLQLSELLRCREGLQTARHIMLLRMICNPSFAFLLASRSRNGSPSSLPILFRRCRVVFVI